MGRDEGATIGGWCYAKSHDQGQSTHCKEWLCDLESRRILKVWDIGRGLVYQWVSQQRWMSCSSILSLRLHLILIITPIPTSNWWIQHERHYNAIKYYTASSPPHEVFTSMYCHTSQFCKAKSYNLDFTYKMSIDSCQSWLQTNVRQRFSVIGICAREVDHTWPEK